MKLPNQIIHMDIFKLNLCDPVDKVEEEYLGEEHLGLVEGQEKIQELKY